MEFCSHCGATLGHETAQPHATGALAVVVGIITGFGIALVYLFGETLLTWSSGYLLAGRICLGPILAIGWSVLVLAALVYALVNRSISQNLGPSYVRVTVIAALVILSIPMGVCTLADLVEIPACRAPMI